MKLSYNYLKDWIGFKETSKQLADLINLHITEVEELTTSGRFGCMVVGEIKEISPHPNADKLQLTKTDVGSEVLNIVCGAKNIAVGQKVPVALPGAVVAGGLEIKPTTIRGEESFGMLCSKRELGLAEEADGIYILDDTAAVGMPLGEFLGENEDSTIELKVLSNRPDYLSYLTIAREIAAVLGRDFNPELELDFSEGEEPVKNHLAIKVEEPQLCRRYIGRVIKNIQVKPSPTWMQKVLLASGLRPINNIVDISNFVMLELGQPVHAFDLAKLTEQQIVVRKAKAKETILGLDGVVRALNENMLVIADSTHPVAIAGIMGGEETGVSNQTTELALEVANFDRVSIRKTARALGLHTDSSVRFEKGLSPLLPEIAMQRLVSLVVQDCPDAIVLAGELDICQEVPSSTRTLVVSMPAINQLLGIEIEPDIMLDILNRLDLSATLSGSDLTVLIPHYREDIVGMPDIAEEIIRIYGTDKVANVMPQITIAPVVVSPMAELIYNIKTRLQNLGFIEVYLHPFDQGNKNSIALENPLNQNWTHLKTDLVIGLAEATFMERGERVKALKAFELNTIFESTANVLPNQPQQLVIRVQGPDAYRHVRGAGEALLTSLGINVKYSEVAGLKGLRVSLGKELIGEVALHQADNAYFALSLPMILPHTAGEYEYKEPSRFPAIKFDMTFIVSHNIKAGEMLADILSADILVDRAELKDLYSTADGHRKLTFHIELRSSAKTLTKDDRDVVYGIIKNKLQEHHKANLDEG
ncbi:MAG: phenylalanine--tRNA ligase subunit beta [Patescibacteria group bacterium]|nr:phenylalanine--tRNA ligase subunit beta [Patescibacteria group bacterium]